MSLWKKRISPRIKRQFSCHWYLQTIDCEFMNFVLVSQRNWNFHGYDEFWRKNGLVVSFTKSDVFLLSLFASVIIKASKLEETKNYSHYRSSRPRMMWPKLQHGVTSCLITGNACRDTYPCIHWHCKNTYILWFVARAASLSTTKVFGILAADRNAATK